MNKLSAIVVEIVLQLNLPTDCQQLLVLLTEQHAVVHVAAEVFHCSKVFAPYSEPMMERIMMVKVLASLPALHLEELHLVDSLLLLVVHLLARDYFG